MSDLKDRFTKNALAFAGRRQGSWGAVAFYEREGVKTRRLPECRSRGEVLSEHDIPCCGGKVRREFEFECTWPENKAGRAWSMQCIGNYGVCRGADGKDAKS